MRSRFVEILLRISRGPKNEYGKMVLQLAQLFGLSTRATHVLLGLKVGALALLLFLAPELVTFANYEEKFSLPPAEAVIMDKENGSSLMKAGGFANVC